MAGTKLGGLKAAQKNLSKDPLFYEKIGRKGGLSSAGEEYQKGGSLAVGFAADPERARLAGRKGGRISRKRKVTTPDEELTQAHISLIEKLFPWTKG